MIKPNAGTIANKTISNIRARKPVNGKCFDTTFALPQKDAL
jgi:hypothetical protein